MKSGKIGGSLGSKALIICTFLCITLFIFLSLTFTINLVNAQLNSKEVGYITTQKTIKPEIKNALNSLGLNVTLIRDSNVTAYNLSKFRMLFIDDVLLSKTKNIPIYKYPSIIMNKYYGPEWGLSDRDGLSQLASTSPLQVLLIGNGQVDVYTQAKEYQTSLSIPYYYIEDTNHNGALRPIVMESIARAFVPSKDGNVIQFGDAVGAIQRGTILENGQKAGGKLCFYGIAKTQYWTSAANDLFLKCAGSVLVECKNDSFCLPDTLVSKNYCRNDDIYQNVTGYRCENPNTLDAQCVNNVIPNLIQNCSDYCVNTFSGAECRNFICHNNSECNDNNVNTEDICVNPNTVDSHCTHNIITCFNNSQCGNFNSNLRCSGDNSINDSITPTCFNPGTNASYCSDVTTNITTPCLFGCNVSIGLCTKAQCSNELDDDLDSLTDIADPGCHRDGNMSNNNSYDPNDNNESNTPIFCSSDPDCDDLNVSTLDKCHNAGTTTSYCTNTPINCFTNSDCGIDGSLGDYFCNGGIGKDIFVHIISFTCNNPGTTSSYCTNSTRKEIADICLYGCFNGSCLPENKAPVVKSIFPLNNYNTTDTNINFVYNVTDDSPIDNCKLYLDGDAVMVENPVYPGENSFSYAFLPLGMHIWGVSCEDINGNTGYSEIRTIRINPVKKLMHDVAFYSTNSNYTNNILIQQNGKNVLGNPAIINCSSNFALRVNLRNNGDYDETVNIFGAIGNNSVIFNNPVFTLNEGDTTFRNPTVNYNFTAGLYTLIINATTGFTDDNPSDNFVVRQIQVVCRGEEIINCTRNEDCDDINASTLDVCNFPGTTSSFCTNTNIRCFNNLDCGDNNIYTADTCNFPGTTSSFCSYQDIICWNNGDCNDDDLHTLDTCNNAGTIFSSCSYQNITCLDDSECNDDNSSTFDVCHNPGAINSFCTNTNIRCFNNLDCSDNNIYTADTCNFPGTTSSFCSYQDIICWNNGDCEDNNASTIDNCHNPGTINSFCTNTLVTPNITCYTDSQCGTDGFTGGLYCDGDDLSHDYMTFKCNNAGTKFSSCSNSTQVIVDQNCEYGCNSTTIPPSCNNEPELLCGDIKATPFNIRFKPSTMSKPNCPESDWYYYDLNITETTGDASVRLFYRLTRWLNGDVEPKKYDAVNKFGTDTVQAGETITAYNRWYCTDFHPENRTETWFGATNALGCPNVTASFSLRTA